MLKSGQAASLRALYCRGPHKSRQGRGGCRSAKMEKMHTPGKYLDRFLATLAPRAARRESLCLESRREYSCLITGLGEAGCAAAPAWDPQESRSPPTTMRAQDKD